MYHICLRTQSCEFDSTYVGRSFQSFSIFSQKLKDTRKQSADQILKSQQFCHVQQIRHKLLCFINGLQSYVNTVALQSSWVIFCDELQQVKSLEDICRSHAQYLNRIGFLCMLTKKSHGFLAKLEDIFCLIIRFCR